MITSNKMPELAPTDIVKFRDGNYGIVLQSSVSKNNLSIFMRYTNNEVSCREHLTAYEGNFHNNDHSSDIIAVWKSNIKTQAALMNSFFFNNRPPLYLESAWKEGQEITLTELEEIVGHPFVIVEETEREEKGNE